MMSSDQKRFGLWVSGFQLKVHLINLAAKIILKGCLKLCHKLKFKQWKVR